MAAVSELCEIQALGERLAGAFVRIEMAVRDALVLLREFDACEGWGQYAAKSMAHWLSWRVGLDLRTAREHVRVARRLAELPLVDAAFARGELSYSKVRALCRVAKPETEETLVMIAVHATGAELERVCRLYREVSRDLIGGGKPTDEQRFVRCRQMASGMIRIEVQLPPDEAETVIATLESLAAPAAKEAVDPETELEGPAPENGSAGPSDCAEPPLEGPRLPDGSAEPLHRNGSAEPSYGARLADALVAVMESARNEHPKFSSGSAHELMVHAEVDTLRRATGPAAVMDDGSILDATILRRIACDAAMVVVARGEGGETLDVGRRSRTVPPAMRRALRIRDRGCRFPSCTTHRHVDAHHIHHWVDGGETKLGNLVELCRHHPRLVHEGGFGLRHHAGGRFEFLDREGNPIARVPSRTPKHHEPSLAEPLEPELLRRVFPRKTGERIDYDFVIEGLTRLAISA